MEWLKLLDAVLVSVVACFFYESALKAPENFAKVLATIREHARWLQPRPRE